MKRMNERVGWLPGWLVKLIDGWMDGWIFSWIDGWLGGWIVGGNVKLHITVPVFSVLFYWPTLMSDFQ